ncbi:MAG: DUF4362 domain-containing protein [Paenibacillus sp.]|nr:DUF4362 domain-containing protein [Paenibacillus sp.]
MKVIKLLLISSLLITLVGCSNGPEKAKKNGDVVSDFGVVGNMYKLDKFILDTESKTQSKVNITRFTKEGDPIYIHLDFNGREILMEKDSSRDKNGKGIKKFICKSISKLEKSDGTHYEVADCQPNTISELLVYQKK